MKLYLPAILRTIKTLTASSFVYLSIFLVIQSTTSLDTNELIDNHTTLGEAPTTQIPQPNDALSTVSKCIDRPHDNYADLVAECGTLRDLKDNLVGDIVQPDEISLKADNKSNNIFWDWAHHSYSSSYQIIFYSPLGTSIFGAIFVCLFGSFLYFFDKPTTSTRVLSGVRGWLIDTPPMLGIIGTLFAMTSYFSSQALESGAQFSGFFESFAFAASSTIVGGLVSVINHFLLSLR